MKITLIGDSNYYNKTEKWLAYSTLVNLLLSLVIKFIMQNNSYNKTESFQESDVINIEITYIIFA